MTKQKDLIQLMSWYGSKATLEEIIEQKDLPYLCPKCKGEGFTRKRYNAYPSGLPDSGWVEDIQEKKVPCDVCDEEGYTREEMEPEVKTEILGYRKKG